ncbi:Prolipoprotein diacylglyceryl transferase [hydrothermal vent metagenome]|uniref:Prolipoprotein diacylglyceryl transferase n=1 Tax=hydrothermal vent metagenome TaxID=652676 RepID=A0A3B1E6P1_9ZZZZ
MNYWQNIYSHFDPIAFNLWGISVHWYGIMYATGLLVAIYFAHWLIKKDKLDISSTILDSYILWIEIGIILGARLGYVLFYDTHTYFYITHPWYIFNPFASDGTFIGISGMSYHGAALGFITASILWCRKYKKSFWFMTDIAVIAVSIGYIFGRIGNFINKELIGRVTDVSWGIYINGTLRHPSALYESFLEGFIVFIILFSFRKKKQFNGQLAILYMILYSIMRVISEVFRQPDIQLGFLGGTSWLTMGMLISGIFAISCTILYMIVKYIIIKK